uniref:Uncharacterized protein TCIL3000_11_12870 n=1 Tax=Trypanosoma congolense (strain IL3000) TaxID=1068625 RepID=G0V2B7_TRYCI|nr:unnamed protein product [Trypanosoma congolense IL3000]
MALSASSRVAAPDQAQGSTMKDGTPSSSKRHVDLVEMPVIVCPLQNLGNTCYFNSGVQLLVNCPQFVYCLSDSPLHYPRFQWYIERVSRLCGAAALQLFRSFAQLVYDMEFARLGVEGALEPQRALDSLSAVHPLFEGRGQQDCPEMVSAVIANLSEVGRSDIDLDSLMASFEADSLILRNGAGSSIEDLPQTDNSGHATWPGEDAIVGLECRPMYAADHVNHVALQPFRGIHSSCDLESEVAMTHPIYRNYQLPVFPGSWSNINALRICQLVNYENELLEIKEKIRKDGLPVGAFCKPKVYHNSVTDGFTGKLLSEIRCHTCQRSSRIVESFSSLTITIPSPARRLQYSKKHPEVQRLKSDGTPQNLSSALYWRSIFSWFYAATQLIFSLFTGFSSRGNCPVSLQECLDIHFEPVELKGSNMYHCSTCDAKREATKRETLLVLPEYLLLHMKRFEQGKCFNTKKTDAVIYPLSWNTGEAREMDVLRLRRYMNKTVLMPPLLSGTYSTAASEGDNNLFEGSSRPTTTQGPNDRAKGVPDGNPSCPHELAVTCNPELEIPIDSYTLEAVVNHHGTLANGHYTAFARKKTQSKDVWLYLNDNELMPTDVNTVADSEEYLLLYKKQSLYSRSEKFEKLRLKARELLAKPSPVSAMRRTAFGGASGYDSDRTGSDEPQPGGGGEIVYISRHWLQRMTFMEEPGPIYNRLEYRTERKGGAMSPSSSDTLPGAMPNLPMSKNTTSPPYASAPPVEWFYVPLQQCEYDAFYNMYGGNRAVTQREYAALREEQGRCR